MAKDNYCYNSFIIVEPEPCTTDCWAQGSVPRRIVTPRPESLLEEVVEEVTDDSEEYPNVLPTV